LRIFDGENFEYEINTNVYDRMIQQSYKLMSTHFNEHEERIKRKMSETMMNDIYEYLCKVRRNDLNTKVWLRTAFENALNAVWDAKRARQITSQVERE